MSRANNVSCGVEERFRSWYEKGNEYEQGFEKAMRFYFKLSEKYKQELEKTKLFARVLREAYNFRFGNGIVGVVTSEDIFEKLNGRTDLKELSKRSLGKS